MSIYTSWIENKENPEKLKHLELELLTIFSDFLYDYTCKAWNEKWLNLSYLAILAKTFSNEDLEEIWKLVDSIFNTDDLPHCDQDDFKKMWEHLKEILKNNCENNHIHPVIVCAQSSMRVSVDSIIKIK